MLDVQTTLKSISINAQGVSFSSHDKLKALEMLISHFDLNTKEEKALGADKGDLVNRIRNSIKTMRQKD